MIAASLIRSAPAIPAHPWPRHLLSQEQWRTMAAALPATAGLDLIAMWADAHEVHALFLEHAVPAGLIASVPVQSGCYPSLSHARPVACWFERAIRDLWGHGAEDAIDQRPWLDHGVWEISRPLSARPPAVSIPPQPPEFLPVEGDDLHQLAVGPIHAGIIEAGHFRFHCAGETVVRLETLLGYTHKGILSLLRGKSPRTAARFPARLSGDATVAHSIAFARAAEAACATPPPARAVMLRAVMGELERIANHCNDVGAICNDVAFAALAARLHFHREQIMRAAHNAFGHRLMMDCVIPGGVAADIAPGGATTILAAVRALETELPEITRIFDDASSLVDRLCGTGKITAAIVNSYAAGGPVGKASGRGGDSRRVPGYPPYDAYPVAATTREAGDVDARARIRLAEISQSIQLLRSIVSGMPEGPTSVPLPPASGEGLGWAESFRGDCWAWLRLESGLISASFLADPSWRHWPLLESAVIGNIVADFPLINKSLNGSYSGVDL